ncbi:Ger(x)C family spore germination protein [Paenibacillus lignilyticus]|uniref:Ger(X)C family spore germination protein n=1 Tax=Paenibacillus lignilyticus TaxID=1172615 RepID=A0ABS5C653_9BACL|nr:Ger(x)C family spore germination protein [Paenibacillus lignilyticus]MBP3961478.1 Ger(x)C family spore germination protein [Paenibacillus lignilyticus]
MTRLSKALLLLLPTLLLTCMLSGCGDTTDLSAQAFVTAMGIDYQDGQFVVSVQTLDFSSIAKSESPKSTNPSVWVGIGRGKSVHTATNQIAIATQSTLNFEQVKVVIVREPAMAKMNEILDAVNRVRVTRYTSWIFGTRGEMMELLTSSAFFNLSQMYSLIYSPLTQAKQSSSVPPVTMQTFVADYNEKAVTALLPSVGVTKDTWHENTKPITVQELEGVFAFKGKRKPVYLPLKQSLGVRWASNRFKRAVYAVQNKGDGTDVVTIKHMKVKKKVRMNNGRPTFELQVKAKGELTEMGNSLTLSQLEVHIREMIRTEINQTYIAGVKQGADLFNLEETLYRYHLPQWKKTASAGGWHPHENDLKVSVSFKIVHAGVFEMK